MTEEQIEQEIQKRGLTALRLTPDDIDNLIEDVSYQVFHDRMTICILRLKNGFLLAGESSCISKENFNQEIGEKIAFQNARNKIWMLEGYSLMQKSL